MGVSVAALAGLIVAVLVLLPRLLPSSPTVAAAGPMPTRAAPTAADFQVASPPTPTATATATPGPGTRACASAPAPGQLVITSACINAAIAPASIKNGAYQIPPNAQTVGLTGAALTADDGGASVLAGHVDTNTGAVGALWNLHLVQPGDEIWTATLDGRTQHWRITSAQTILQTDVAARTNAFNGQGPRRLIIITCTGAVTPGVGYTHNLVVTAAPDS